MGIARAEHAGRAQAGKIGFLNPSLQHPPMLSPAAARSPLHNRAITFRGYAREDGLWDLEGHLTDVWPTAVPCAGGMLDAGKPMHDMWLRLTVDRTATIVAVQAVTDAGFDPS